MERSQRTQNMHDALLASRSLAPQESIDDLTVATARQHESGTAMTVFSHCKNDLQVDPIKGHSVTWAPHSTCEFVLRFLGIPSRSHMGNYVSNVFSEIWSSMNDEVHDQKVDAVE